MEYTRYHLITDQTDKEWPKDHPLRKGALIVSREAARQLGEVYICQLVGEERIPPPNGDKDLRTKCCKCRRKIVHRKSAPNLPKICWECWTRGNWP